MILINAVRDADAQASYPDYYGGRSKKPSDDYYPARTRQRHHRPGPSGEEWQEASLGVAYRLYAYTRS